ncbi:hypothetical protein MASR2M15_12240 [Anaerolineales bacterium]|jgi:F-type H+-transporting ATPase subunit gamma
MPTLREVKTRIRSVRNIAQITRALEAVSASRVRRAQARVLATRAYSEKAWEIMVNLQHASMGASSHPLLIERSEVKNVMVILITSDRGLAGAYNTNVLRVVKRFNDRVGKPVQYVTVGRKGIDTLRFGGLNIVAEFESIPAEPTIMDIRPIARLAIDAFLSGQVDEVLVAYTDFINMLAQRPTVLGWLPLSDATIAANVVPDAVKMAPVVSGGASDYEYEPSATAVLEEIVPRFTELQLYQAVLESIASEHAARMSAMRSATDNASQLTEDLTLVYNKARQTAITGEILDIVGGAAALQETLDKAANKILAQVAEAERVAYANQIVEEPVAAVQSESKPKSKSGSSDDLTRIEGIGPKMSVALINAGIDSFDKLAQSSDEEILAAIQAANMRFAPSLSTWSAQARFAADGDWEGLDALQKQLNAGRKE